MEISSRVTVKRKPEGKILANASITLDNEIVITGLQIVAGSKGLFVSMPQYRDSEGEYHDRFYALNKETREKINTSVLEEYQNQTSHNDHTDNDSDNEY